MTFFKLDLFSPTRHVMCIYNFFSEYMQAHEQTAKRERRSSASIFANNSQNVLKIVDETTEITARLGRLSLIF